MMCGGAECPSGPRARAPVSRMTLCAFFGGLATGARPPTTRAPSAKLLAFRDDPARAGDLGDRHLVHRDLVDEMEPEDGRAVEALPGRVTGAVAIKGREQLAVEGGRGRGLAHAQQAGVADVPADRLARQFLFGEGEPAVADH